jgi:hypothetical protein
MPLTSITTKQSNPQSTNVSTGVREDAMRSAGAKVSFQNGKAFGVCSIHIHTLCRSYFYNRTGLKVTYLVGFGCNKTKNGQRLDLARRIFLIFLFF